MLTKGTFDNNYVDLHFKLNAMGPRDLVLSLEWILSQIRESYICNHELFMFELMHPLVKTVTCSMEFQTRLKIIAVNKLVLTFAFHM